MLPVGEAQAHAEAQSASAWVGLHGLRRKTDLGTVGQGDDVVSQCRAALEIIAKALAEAGASFADVIRVNYYLPDAAEFEPCWPVLAEAFGKNPPAATMIECGLIDRKYRIEIEVTALAPQARGGTSSTVRHTRRGGTTRATAW